MLSSLYKLSPSDFKYLWEDCKHCYYRKVKEGIALPSIGMPKIFGKMNDLAQSAMLGMNLHDVHSDLPPGKFDKKERFLKSTPVPNYGKAFISGRFDLLTLFEDGSHGIIDLKITDTKSENLHKFSTQLHAYKFALENPADGQERMVDRITRMGLLIMSPESVEFRNGGIVFHAKPQWISFEEDVESFYSFIDGVTEFLEGSLPEPTENCAWCKYRSLTSRTEVGDIPF